MGFAIGKFQVTGNSKELPRNSLLVLGEYGAASVEVITHLGIDYSDARRSKASVGALGLRKRAWIDSKRRRRRIHSLQPQRRPKRAKLFFRGQLPAATHGEEGAGLAPQIVMSLRREGGQALGLLGQGSNIILAWAVEAPRTDPVKHAAATLHGHCQEWWAMTDPTLAPAGGLSGGVLTRSLRLAEADVSGAGAPSWAKSSLGPLHDVLLR